MGLHPQRIDNLIDFLDKVESTLTVADLANHKKDTLIEDLRVEVIEVLKDGFLGRRSDSSTQCSIRPK